MKQRLLAWCVMASLLALVVLTTTTVAEVLTCGQEMATYKDVPAYSNGTSQGAKGPECNGRGKYGLEFECVEYVRRFYEAPDRFHAAYSTAPRQWPGLNAKQFFSELPKLGFARFLNGNTALAPAPDDILVFEGGENGHVAIITSTTETHSDIRVSIIEQNWPIATPETAGTGNISGTKSADGIYTLDPRGRYRVLGWLRPADWPMSQRDPQHTGYSPDAAISIPLTQRWTYTASDEFRAAVTLANGIAYAGSVNGKIYALDAVTGGVRWIYDTGLGSTSFSSALVSGDKVYIASNGGGASGTEDSKLYVLKTNPVAPPAGELARNPATLGPVGEAPQSSPVLFDGVVYVGSSGKYLSGRNRVWALDPETLQPVWVRIITDDPIETRKYVNSSPAVTETSVVVGTWGSCTSCQNIFAFDRLTGAAKW